MAKVVMGSLNHFKSAGFRNEYSEGALDVRGFEVQQFIDDRERALKILARCQFCFHFSDPLVAVLRAYPVVVRKGLRDRNGLIRHLLCFVLRRSLLEGRKCFSRHRSLLLCCKTRPFKGSDTHRGNFHSGYVQ